MKLIQILIVVMAIAASGCTDEKENPFTPTENPKSWGADDFDPPKKSPKE